MKALWSFSSLALARAAARRLYLRPATSAGRDTGTRGGRLEQRAFARSLHRTGCSPAGSTSAIAGTPESAEATIPIAASSTFARVPSCSVPTSRSPIPSTAGSTRFRCGPPPGATSRRSSLHIEAKKSSIYDFNADYRDFAYFNFLPSYADPLLGQGVVLGRAILRYAAQDRRAVARPPARPLVDSLFRLGSRFRVPAPALRCLSPTATISGSQHSA